MSKRKKPLKKINSLRNSGYRSPTHWSFLTRENVTLDLTLARTDKFNLTVITSDRAGKITTHRIKIN